MAATQHSTDQGGHDSVTDPAEHQATFEAFMRFWVYVFGASAAVLIFLAIFNT